MSLDSDVDTMNDLAKWTLAFNIPRVRDSQFSSVNKIPDIEDFSRKDYTYNDWLALIGRHRFVLKLILYVVVKVNDLLFGLP